MASLASLSRPRPGGAAGGPSADLPTPVGPLPPRSHSPWGRTAAPSTHPGSVSSPTVPVSLRQEGSQQESHAPAAQGLPSSVVWPEPLKAEGSSLPCLREIGLSFVQRKGLSLTRPV